MKIKKLELKNFRGFEDLTIDFPEGESGLAVFVGVNGSGKTSVLEGLNILLQIFSQGIFVFNNDIEVTNNDIMNGAANASGRLDLDDETKVMFKLHRAEGVSLPSLNSNTIPEYTWTEASLDDAKESLDGFDLPIISYYPSNRFVPEEPSLKTKDMSQPRQYDAYEGAFNKRIDYTTFFEWFRNTEDFENEQRLYNETAFRDKGLETVRRAISSFLNGFVHPRVRRQPKEELIIEKNGLTLSLGNLSSGEKSILALFGDLARRLYLSLIHI